MTIGGMVFFFWLGSKGHSENQIIQKDYSFPQEKIIFFGNWIFRYFYDIIFGRGDCNAKYKTDIRFTKQLERG